MIRAEVQYYPEDNEWSVFLQDFNEEYGQLKKNKFVGRRLTRRAAKKLAKKAVKAGFEYFDSTKINYNHFYVTKG